MPCQPRPYLTDHAKYIDEYVQNGVKVYSNDEVAGKHDKVSILQPNQWNAVDDFLVYPFLCMHDAKNCGYVVKHPEFGTILFGTDTMAYPVTFKGIRHFLVEANYSDELLRKSNVAESLKRRVIVSHMSLDYCIKYLHDCHAENAETITLIHLSANHSDADEFKLRVQAEFGTATYIADKGEVINLNTI